jgi:thiol-disulfide isomerase/thioredoxin
MKKAFALASLIALAVVIIAGSAGAGTPAPLSTPELRKVIGSGKKHTIVFFQNPMGGPCRAQKEIVQRLLKDRKNGFNVADISTMKAEDQPAFYDYGVRNLPTIVLVDKKGAIANYFPPGIQSYETLGAALDALK